MQEYDTFLHSFLSMFEHQYGDIELKPLYKTKSPVSAAQCSTAAAQPEAANVVLPWVNRGAPSSCRGNGQHAAWGWATCAPAVGARLHSPCTCPTTH